MGVDEQHSSLFINLAFGYRLGRRSLISPTTQSPDTLAAIQNFLQVKKLYYILSISLSFLFLTYCNSGDSDISQGATIEKNFLDDLVDTPFSDSIYSIAIPTNYKLSEREGPDFSVFYFSPKDTTIKAKYSGGLYFGNHPNEFEPESDSCRIESDSKQILGDKADWKVFVCKGNYSTQTVVDSKSGKKWSRAIHAFGNATSKRDLNKVFAIFATLKKR